MRTLKSAGLLLSLLGVQVATGAEAANESVSLTYRWHAELVATNPHSRSLTVKARMVSREALADVDDLRAGDDIVLTWSGLHERAHGIRRVDRRRGVSEEGDRFRLAAEFDAVDLDTQYLTFTIDATVDSLDAVSTLEPGDWATFISAHQLRDDWVVLTASAFGESPPTPAAPVAVQRRSTYQWHGELVTLDQPAGAITLKSRIVSGEGLTHVDQLHTGDPILITWSGSGQRAHGIRLVEPAAHTPTHRRDFQIPATFIAANPASRHLTFRVRTRDGGLAAITDLEPGAWTTMTSPHRPTDTAHAVMMVDAFDHARRARRYTWPGELIAVDASSRTVSVSAPVEAHVLRYVERFTEGDEVVLIWTPGSHGDATSIRYLEPRARSVLDPGYVLPVRFGAADERPGRLSFTARVPASTVASWASFESGTEIRATALFDQRDDAAAILTVKSSVTAPTLPRYGVAAGTPSQ